jgi:hypothetical protein
MTQVTDTDSRELKTAIDGNTRAIDGLIRATEANAKAIADLTLEMRVGFSGIQGQITNLDTKLGGQITNLDTKLSGQITNAESKLEGKIDALGEKFDERTKGMGQRLDGKELAQRNIFTGLTVTIVGAILLSLGKYLFFGTLP